MPISLNQLIDRAFRVANMTGQDANSSPVIDAQVVLEDLLPVAMREAIIGKSGNPGNVGGLKQELTLTFTDGAAPKPAGLVDECLDTSTLTGDDIAELTSYQPRYFDYIRPVWPQLGYYTVNGNSVLFREPGGSPGEYDGDLTLNAVAMPTISSASADLEISNELADDVVVRLAAMLVETASAIAREIREREERT